MPPRVELVYDGDCPNVGRARAQLLSAFGEAGLPARWREWRRDGAHAPVRVRRLGSPTILVNGSDVAPLASDATCCRVYAQPGGGMAGVPPVELIASAIRNAGNGSRWKSIGLWGPAVGIAFLPKLVCPACWPAYAALAGALGMPFLWETRFLLPITGFALGLVIGMLAWRARERRGYGPALLGVAASGVIVIGKFVLSSNPAAYAGASVLLAACVWNTWPRRRSAGTAPCPACEPDHSATERRES